MQVGIFCRVFVRPTLDAALDAVAAHGIRAVQFDLAEAGLASMPDELPVETAREIRTALDTRGITMAAVSGTYNMAHPDPAQRRDGLRRLGVLAAACQELGTLVITLCTGTRDPDSMWRRHPDNDTPEAWQDMRTSLAAAARLAEAHDVTLAFEPEVSNVVDSAAKARRILDEVGSPRLQVCIDGANLYHAGELARMGEILDAAFALLGDDVVLAHAKDVDRDGEAGHLAAGTGQLDYDRYLRLLRASGYDGAVILHSLSEAQADTSVAFLRGKLTSLARNGHGVER